MNKTLFSEDELNRLAEVEADAVEVRKRKHHEVRKLRWYERQYGAGFINGFWTGVSAGFVLVPLIAWGCKVFLEWLFAMA